MKKHLIVALFVLSLALPFVYQAEAALESNNLWGGQRENIATGIGVSSDNQDPRVIASNVIRIILGFLGIIAVVIILLAGFKWMTAGGDSKKVEEAQSLMKSGIIGLVIILSAFAVANFVINTLVSNVVN